MFKLTFHKGSVMTPRHAYCPNQFKDVLSWALMYLGCHMDPITVSDGIWLCLGFKNTASYS